MKNLTKAIALMRYETDTIAAIVSTPFPKKEWKEIKALLKKGDIAAAQRFIIESLPYSLAPDFDDDGRHGGHGLVNLTG